MGKPALADFIQQEDLRIFRISAREKRQCRLQSSARSGTAVGMAAGRTPRCGTRPATGKGLRGEERLRAAPRSAPRSGTASAQERRYQPGCPREGLG